MVNITIENAVEIRISNGTVLEYWIKGNKVGAITFTTFDAAWDHLKRYTRPEALNKWLMLIK